MFNIDSGIISLIIDACLIVGVLLLWLSWHRNGKRQQRLEQMLAQTAEQLEEAGRHLNQATQAIEHLKQQEKNQQVKATASVKSAIVRNSGYAASLARDDSHISTILRMQREGESAEIIAGKLGIPLAQVRLMLKLHAASPSS
jgi:hypothetical protein